MVAHLYTGVFSTPARNVVSGLTDTDEIHMAIGLGVKPVLMYPEFSGVRDAPTLST